MQLAFIRSCFLLAVCFLWSFSHIALATTPQVAVTLKPIHSLVANIMQGVGEPELLLPDGASPHTFQLKPSTLKQLQQADLVIWVGPQLELFMVKPLKQIHSSLGLITLAEIPGLEHLPLRQGREWEHAHDHDHNHDHDHAHDHTHALIDPHFWLCTHNAQIITQYITASLSKLDPMHATIYNANAAKLNASLIQLKETLETTLKEVQNKPFLVYHDGYQYFEHEFHLNAVGSMIVNPHLPLSAHGLNAISHLITEHHIQCVFRETEFKNDLIEKSLAQFHVKVAELDPLGARIPKGPDNYEKTMLAIGNTLKDCLQSN